VAGAPAGGGEGAGVVGAGGVDAGLGGSAVGEVMLGSAGAGLTWRPLPQVERPGFCGEGAATSSGSVAGAGAASSAAPGMRGPV
jgi:hypothetical protein